MKKILIFVFALVLVFALTGCNMQVIDTTYHFDKAIIHLPNGEIVQGEVEFWGDYTDGDMIQIRIDGVTYFTHSSNAVLISE